MSPHPYLLCKLLYSQKYIRIITTMCQRLCAHFTAIVIVQALALVPSTGHSHTQVQQRF